MCKNHIFLPQEILSLQKVRGSEVRNLAKPRDVMGNLRRQTTMKQTVIILTFGLLTALLTGCDPYYSITVTNNTSETAQILVKETINFRTDKQKSLTTMDGFDVYELAPNEQIKVGSAIAEIDNDIPFEQLKIIRNRDTITANNLETIKNLFDKKTFGGLKTPYNISIK